MRNGRGWAGVVLAGIASAVVLAACSAPAPAVDNGPDGPVGTGPGENTGLVTGSPEIGMGAPNPEPGVGPDGGMAVYTDPAAPERAPAPSVMPDYDYGYGVSYGYDYGYAYYPPPANLPPSGIHVTGVGAVKVSPDLAILSAGVEARADDVETARAQAAEAMEAVLAELRALGVREDDIQTRHFSIQPQYTWREVVDQEMGYRHGEQVLVGYRVTNNIEVKVRDLDGVGAVVDAVASAARDTVRVHHISFTIEDPRAVEAEARELAVREARAKAGRMAEWAGESLGRLVYLVETSRPSPVRVDMPMAEDGRSGGPAPNTPIVPGDLEVRVTVQGVWDVQ